jgi:regulator of protease activity HflC (stomatin/prohibitin superfamily)
MPLLKTITVAENERVLIARRGRSLRILEPGIHRVLGWGVTAETWKLADTELKSDWNDVLVNQYPEVVKRHFTLVETGDTEVAIVYADGRVLQVITPGKRALFWKELADISFERIDVIGAPEVPAEKRPGLMKLGVKSGAFFVAVDEGKAGLLFLDNRLIRSLRPGVYGFWSVLAPPRVELIDLRTGLLEISGQEVLTKDKVSIRVNISAQYRVADPVKARQSVKDHDEHLYRALQMAVRQSLGRRTLDEILADKVDLDPALLEALRKEMADIGVEVGFAALKDVILPGEMRDMMNQVVAAEKQAQANLIRRREETAATRSLLNTAKLMEENPLLIRMKELETLEKLTGKVERISLLGGFDGLLTSLLNPFSAKDTS